MNYLAKIALAYLFLTSPSLGDPSGDYKEMFQMMLHEYDLFFLEHSPSTLLFKVRLSSERKEHLCSIKLSFGSNLFGFNFLDSAHRNLTKEVPSFPDTPLFCKNYYKELFSFMVGSYDKRSTSDFVFLEQLLASLEEGFKKRNPQFSFLYRGQEDKYQMMVQDSKVNLFLITFTWNKAQPLSSITYNLEYFDSHIKSYQRDQKTYQAYLNDFYYKPLSYYSDYLNNLQDVAKEIQDYFPRHYKFETVEIKKGLELSISTYNGRYAFQVVTINGDFELHKF